MHLKQPRQILQHKNATKKQTMQKKFQEKPDDALLKYMKEAMTL